MRVQNRHVAAGAFRIVRVVRPRIDTNSRRVPHKIKYLDNPLPYCLPLVSFFHPHTFYMSSFRPM